MLSMLGFIFILISVYLLFLGNQDYYFGNEYDGLHRYPLAIVFGVTGIGLFIYESWEERKNKSNVMEGVFASDNEINKIKDIKPDNSCSITLMAMAKGNNGAGITGSDGAGVLSLYKNDFTIDVEKVFDSKIVLYKYEDIIAKDETKHPNLSMFYTSDNLNYYIKFEKSTDWLDFINRSKILAKGEDNRNSSDESSSPISNADELKKFKELLDSGAITQEEYDTKKKELLDL
jgi:hypothetical protein